MSTSEIKRTVSEFDRINVAFKEMGTDIKFKVIDLEEEAKKVRKYRLENKMSMQIAFDIVGVRTQGMGYESRDYSTFHAYDKDDSNDVYYGIVSSIHKDGNPIWTKIPLSKSEVFDLNNGTDMKKYLVMRMAAFVEGSPLQIEGHHTVKYKIIDQEIESKKAIKNADDLVKAIGRISKIRIEDAIRLSRWLGIPLSQSNTEADIKAKLINYATTNSSDFNEKYDSADRKYYEVLETGIKTGVIKDEIGVGYFFNGLAMGTKKPFVIDFFKKNPDTISSIEQEITGKDTVANKLGGSKEEEVKVDASGKDLKPMEFPPKSTK